MNCISAKTSKLRWFVAIMLFLAAVLNYVDKNSLSLLSKTIRADLNLSVQDYANIQNAFQVAYTVALLGSGVIVDRFGSRLSLALFVGWWSVANMLTAFARSIGSFGVFRFLLGLGEAGNWTASPKAVSEWFPAKERGLAIGIYTAGTPIGMTAAPLFIIWLQEAFGWRSAFVVTGALGLVWLVPWLMLRCSNHATSASDLSQEIPVSTDESDEERGWTWFESFGRVEVWCLLLGRMFSDPVWFFYQNWYPEYLGTARNLSQSDIKITWVLFLAAGMGSLVGGWISGVFIRRGRRPSHVRLFVMLACAMMMPVSPFVAYSPTVTLSLTFASLIAFAHLAWLTNITALVVDVVPKRSLGAVFGIVAAGSSVGAIAMNQLIATFLKPDPITKIVSPNAYNSWYVIAAFLHLAVVPLLMWGILRRKRRA